MLTPTEQPQSTANASRKPPEILREPRRRSARKPAALRARKTEEPLKKSAHGGNTRIDSIRRAGRQLGFPCAKNGWLPAQHASRRKSMASRDLLRNAL